MSDAILVLHCKASDYDSVTGQCVAPFYGPASSFPPPLDVAEGIQLSALIAGCWAIGYMIRSARRVVGT